MTEETNQILKEQIIEKQNVVNEIKEKIDSSSAFYITKYDGINVEDISSLRKKLREVQSEMKVFKNTLLKRALEGKDYENNFTELLNGPNSITDRKSVV